MGLINHPWDVSVAEARRIQEELRALVERGDRFGQLRTVAGVDVSVRGGLSRAAVVVLAFPSLQLVEERLAELPVAFPYVPGLLAFREAPAVLAAWRNLVTLPDLVVFDAHGLAHPRRFGLACHLGLVLDRPTIGCAKSRLCGDESAPAAAAGSWAALTDTGEIIGAAVRTKANVRPVYVSTGHRVALATAIAVTLACCRGHRLPEPTRLAHLAGR